MSEGPERVFLTPSEASWRTTRIDDHVTSIPTIAYVRSDLATCTVEERAAKHWSLTKGDDSEYPYKDQDGVWWQSPATWLFIGILGGCGCGSSDEFSENAVALLRFFNTPHDKRNFSSIDPATELLAHWFSGKGLIEHGSILTGAWLSEKGKQVLGAIDSLGGDPNHHCTIPAIVEGE